jgi:hypothetical protein
MASMPLFRRSSSLLLFLVASGLAAPRPHTVLLGKWRTVRVVADSGQARDVKIRELVVDARSREYTIGLSHEVTDRLFVIQRVYRVNDALSDDQLKSPQWIWRLGGWISVDRRTGHIAQLNLPAFDPESSEATWYREYAAYCGTADDGAKAYLVVWQLGKRKPVLRKELDGPGCTPPKWERDPSRVTFMIAGEKNTFIVHTRGADPQPESGEEEGPE